MWRLFQTAAWQRSAAPNSRRAWTGRPASRATSPRLLRITLMPSGFAGRAEQLQSLPEQGAGPAELALETGGLAEHVKGLRLPGHVVGLRRLGQFALEMRLGRGVVAHPERHLAEEAVRERQAPVVTQWCTQLDAMSANSAARA